MIHEVGKGGFFGELGLISSNPRLATMTVTSGSARLAVIREEYFVDKANISPDFLLAIFHASIFRTVMARRKLSRCVANQAVKDLGRDITIEAVSHPDGIVEAIRYQRADFVMGLQWHPEFHRAGGVDLLDCTPILDEFLRSARDTRF